MVPSVHIPKERKKKRQNKTTIDSQAHPRDRHSSLFTVHACCYHIILIIHERIAEKKMNRLQSARSNNFILSDALVYRKIERIDVVSAYLVGEQAYINKYSNYKIDDAAKLQIDLSNRKKVKLNMHACTAHTFLHQPPVTVSKQNKNKFDVSISPPIYIRFQNIRLHVTRNVQRKSSANLIYSSLYIRRMPTPVCGLHHTKN